jgi:nicotinamidase-related amidase
MQKCFAAIDDRVRDVAENIRAHVEEESYDAVVFTKFVNSEQSPFSIILENERCMEEPGTDLVEPLHALADEHTVIETDTYSLFNAQAFYSVLDEANPDRFYFAGADIDGTLLATLFDAFDLGHHAHLRDDLVLSTTGSELEEAARTIIDRNLRTMGD